MSAVQARMFGPRDRAAEAVAWQRTSQAETGFFEELALDLFAAQYERNPPYRRFCEARAVKPSTVRDWREIPAVPTAAFRDWELSCIASSARTAVFHSSGTTGQQPSRHYHHGESLALYEAALRPWFAAHMLDPELATMEGRERAADFQPVPARRMRMLALTPAGASAPHSSLAHMFETVVRAFGAPDSGFAGELGADGAWTLNYPTARTMLQQAIEENRPLLLLGTAFSFVHLSDELTEHPLRSELPPGSRVMETGGYKGRSRSMPKKELHGLLTRRLGVPLSHIVCEYGMSELSSQAYDHSVGRNEPRQDRPERGFRFPAWVRVQIVSPETGQEVGEGQTGLIRILDLGNVYSVMAVQTEDVGVRRGEGFELIGRAGMAEPRGCSLQATS